MAKKLKDINKDGKVTFADTWLGEKLSGKKMKGPNLKESMAGARRTSDATPKATPKAKKAEISSLAPSTSPKPKARPAPPVPKIVVTKIPKTAQQKASETVDGKRSMYNANTKPDNKNNPNYAGGRSSEKGGGSIENMKKFTKKQWQAMTTEQRRMNNLPIRPIDSWVSAGNWKPEPAKPRKSTPRG